MTPPLLQVRDLSVRFTTASGAVLAVDNLSFEVNAGETVALVGESGCGKSATALALMRLLPPEARVSGAVRLQGRDLLALDARAMRAVRGRHAAIVFQDPMSALNPVMTIGDQLVEAIRAHEDVGHAAAWERAEELLTQVRIPEPRHRLADFPHRFSGGMRQRVVIAMALASRPALLIADEPTTALDVTIQAQILALLKNLQRELGMGLLLITHDLGVVAQTADRVVVMYAGREVESQPVRGLFKSPLHPYTRGLMAARPRSDAPVGGPAPLPATGRVPRQRLQEIPGLVPLISLAGAQAAGCAFAPRCTLAQARCATNPALRGLPGNASVACHRADEARFVEREQPLEAVA